MMIYKDKFAAHTMYMVKLQNMFLYQCAASDLKGFSEGISNRLSNFAEQDHHHALAMHGLIAEMEASIVVPDEFKTHAAVAPANIVRGIGNDTEGLDETKLFITMTENWTDSLKEFESRLYGAYGKVQERFKESPDFKDKFDQHISLDGLMKICERRVKVLSEIHDMAGYLFERKNDVKWRCEYCGYEVKCALAPEKCDCCQQDHNWQVIGDWEVMKG